MAQLQPELWVTDTAAAIAFYTTAFGATVLHRVGDPQDTDGVAQLAIDGAAFWVSGGGADPPRYAPLALGGATGRTLLVVSDPDAVAARALAAGAQLISPVADEHGWRLGRLHDPFGHEWEIGRPPDGWPGR